LANSHWKHQQWDPSKKFLNYPNHPKRRTKNLTLKLSTYLWPSTKTSEPNSQQCSLSQIYLLTTTILTLPTTQDLLCSWNTLTTIQWW
jgi:hypothetical protein